MKPILLILALLLSFCGYAKEDVAGHSRIQVSLPYLNGKGELVQDLFYETDTAGSLRLGLYCYQLRKTDSVLIYSKPDFRLRTKKGVQLLHVAIQADKAQEKVNPDITDILKNAGSMPAGSYRTYLFRYGADTTVYSWLQAADSNLNLRSSVRSSVTEAVSGGKQIHVAGVTLSAGGAPNVQKAASAAGALKRAGKLLRRRKLDMSERQQGSQRYLDIYYKDWLVGYYKIDSAGDIAGQLQREEQRMKDNLTAAASSELEDIQSLFSQVRDLKKKSKEQKEGSGQIGLSVYGGTGQEEQSQAENNYYELQGNLEVPVMGIPVSVQGFYTSQDNHRRIKASYVKLHYDTEQAKQELLKLINGYNEKYESTVAKGKGLESVYQSYLGKLRSEQGALGQTLAKETGIQQSILSLDTAGLQQRLTDSLSRRMAADSSLGADAAGNKVLAGTGRASDSARVLYQKAVKQYERAQQLQQSIDKYQRLLDQYKNTNYFDSALAYAKVKDLREGEDLSYKELSKKASSLLPEGKAKTFITGLTHFDAGIFSKEASAYTLSGQTIKGIDAGYDLGFCQTAFTYGRMEYVGRDGSLDRYTGYSARASFKPAKGQKASVIYYGYMPSGKMLSEESFFKDADVSLPSFRSPVHIVSLSYEGQLKKGIRYEAEAASSFRKNNTKTGQSSMHDRMAYHINAEGDIPNTTITVDGGYEHVGTGFENNSAPVNMSGTQRYHTGAKGVFFKNFLTLGAAYNYLEQQSFSGKGGNSKWGFEIKTSSKRYPSVALSYKPFATFRAYNDTLSIPQRPLVGAVWTGKASYQIKKKDYNLRFTTVFSKNSSEIDTVDIRSSVLQLSATYSDKLRSLMVNLGHTDNGSTDSGSVHQAVSFIAISGSYQMDKRWNVQAGVDGGVAAFGISKLGCLAGSSYNFKKLPVSLRGSVRYNTYRLAAGESWRQLVSGNIEFLWRFKFKVKD